MKERSGRKRGRAGKQRGNRETRTYHGRAPTHATVRHGFRLCLLGACLCLCARRSVEGEESLNRVMQWRGKRTKTVSKPARACREHSLPVLMVGTEKSQD